MRSLTTRLSGALIVALVVLTLTLLGGLHYSLRHLAITFISARLENDLTNLLANLNFDGKRHLYLSDEHLMRLYQQPYSGHYYRIAAADRILRSRSLWDTDLALPAAGIPNGEPVFLSGPNAQHLLALQRGYRIQGQPVTILVTEDFEPIAAELNRLQLSIGLAAVAILAILLLAQYFIVRRGLYPLRRVGEELHRLAGGEISQLNPVAPREIRPLVTELNRLLKVLEQRLQRSRHALGNLAHALKTPLAVLVQAAEQVPGATGGELKQQAARIESLIARELKRARIAGIATPGQRVALDQTIPELIDTLYKIHRERELLIDSRIPPGSSFAGDHNDLMELLGNLLDNACRWARHRVCLTVSGNSAGLLLTVEDDGPGCKAEMLDRLTERGNRVDEAGPGHGLGLAIVSEIVEQYHGRLQLDKSPYWQGLRVRVELPGHL